MKYEIFKDFEISCSHRLWDSSKNDKQNNEIFGKCANGPSHGHNYIVRVGLESTILKDGMVRNFTEVKKIFNNKIDAIYDHHFLNECPPFNSGDYMLTTAENLCKVFYDIMRQDIPEVSYIKIWETSKSCACYKEEN